MYCLVLSVCVMNDCTICVLPVLVCVFMYVLAFNKGNVSKRMSRLFVVFVLPGACLIVTYLVRGVRQDGRTSSFFPDRFPADPGVHWSSWPILITGHLCPIIHVHSHKYPAQIGANHSFVFASLTHHPTHYSNWLIRWSIFFKQKNSLQNPRGLNTFTLSRFISMQSHTNEMAAS